MSAQVTEVKVKIAHMPRMIINEVGGHVVLVSLQEISAPVPPPAGTVVTIKTGPDQGHTDCIDLWLNGQSGVVVE